MVQNNVSNILIKSNAGSSILGVMAAVLISAISMGAGISAFELLMSRYQGIQVKDAVASIDDDLRAAGLEIANRFYKNMIWNSPLNQKLSVSVACASPQSHSLLPEVNESISLAAGVKLELLNAGRINAYFNQAKNISPTFLAAKERCYVNASVYENYGTRITDFSSRKGLYWCATIVLPTNGRHSPEAAPQRMGTMEALVEFYATPINLQTGNAVSCTEFQSAKSYDSRNPDTLTMMLYYTVYWSTPNSQGTMVASHFNGLGASGE